MIGLLYIYLTFSLETGEQGNAWRLGEFDIPAKSGRVSIVFEGIRGLGYRGDIALDDVDIKKGPCSPGKY